MTNDDTDLNNLADWLRARPNQPATHAAAMANNRMHELADQIIASEQPRGSHQPPTLHTSRTRRRLIGLIVAPIAVGALAAAGWALLRTDATNALSLSCVSGDVTAVIPHDGTPPIQACTELWRNGAMEPDTTTAPPLIACVDDSSTVAIIEGTNPIACQDADLTVWQDQPAYEAAGAAITEARTQLHARFDATGNGCATQDDWQTLLSQQQGTNDWSITTDNTSANSRCFDIGTADPTTLTITLIPVPGDHSIGCNPRTGC